jgi:uncharacterized protein YjbI with pentapeptide repeats
MQFVSGRTITRELAIEFLKTASLRQVQEWNNWITSVSTDQLPRLDEAELRGCYLTNINLFGLSLKYAVFTHADLSHANLSRCDITGADFSGANLYGARLEDAYCDREPRDDSTRRHIFPVFSHKESTAAPNPPSVSFVLANLQGAILKGAQLDFCQFSGARLEAAKFDRASLSGAVLDGVRVNGDTSFKWATTEGLSIDRYSLLSLDNYGGLTVQQRMDLRIEDGLATMRASFSGVWQWIHLVALLAFVGPYVWFIIARWSEASFVLPGPSVSLLKALSQYIFSGGESWGHGYEFRMTFLLFIFGISYNSLRATLLWKTKQLELQQETSGLPPRFSLTNSMWGLAFKWCHYGFILNILLVGVHTVHFLLQEVPIPS